MLLSNCRIDKNSKIKFYEQDILIDNHIYTGDITVEIIADYISPGLGIALISDEGLSLKDSSISYLFKIGHSDYSLIKKNGSKIEVIENGAVINIKPYIENISVKIMKVNNRISMYVNNILVGKRHLPTELSSFSIGYYSNAGNTINAINIASKIPNGWVVNMNNTNGGRINFASNKFSLSECSDYAEIEQINIPLKANDKSNPFYYLKYDKENIEDKNDIRANVFISEDDRYIDDSKNILTKSGKFYLNKDCNVNIKFKGKIGSIKNIQLTNSSDNFYVGTDYNEKELKASYIKIDTTDLNKIEFEGKVHSIPNEDTNVDNQYSILEEYYKRYSTSDLGITLGKVYSYAIDLKTNVLLLKSQNEERIIEMNITNYLYLFKNVDAEITKLLLYKKDGTIINVTVQDTRIQYIPSAITSPIIVTNEIDEPLNLSSSFRIMTKNNSEEYVFTNIEREIFEPTNRLRLENKLSDKIGSINVFGILKNSDIFDDKLMHIKDGNVNSISDFCNSYEVIKEKDIYQIDKINSTITLFDETNKVDKYKAIVIDYLKNDSYCINYKHSNYCYEVDISSSGKTNMYYDGIINGDITNIEQYKIINMPMENNSYIVVKGR